MGLPPAHRGSAASVVACCTAYGRARLCRHQNPTNPDRAHATRARCFSPEESREAVADLHWGGVEQRCKHFTEWPAAGLRGRPYARIGHETRLRNQFKPAARPLRAGRGGRRAPSRDPRAHLCVVTMATISIAATATTAFLSRGAGMARVERERNQRDVCGQPRV